MHTLFTFGSAVVTAVLTIYFVVFRDQHAAGELRATFIGGAVVSVVASAVLLRYCSVWPQPTSTGNNCGSGSDSVSPIFRTLSRCGC